MNKIKKGWSPNKYLVSAARRIFRWSPERKAVNKTAEEESGKEGYRKCAKCKESFSRKKVHVDHIIPVGPAPKALEGWDGYYTRMFTGRSNLQALCVKCHRSKTNQDIKEMRKDGK